MIVCLIPSKDEQSLEGYLRNWLTENYPKNRLQTGTTVHSANQIRESYLSCFETAAAVQASDGGQSNQTPSIPDRSEQLAQEILTYLRENFCSPSISQTLVADHFKISTYSLSRLFKSHFGIGFTEYISTQRIEYAKQLLLTTDRPVSEIASTVGLPNVNYFSRLFKSMVGIPPLKYRNQFVED